jgi:hypothetical protein
MSIVSYSVNRVLLELFIFKCVPDFSIERSLALSVSVKIVSCFFDLLDYSEDDPLSELISIEAYYISSPSCNLTQSSSLLSMYSARVNPCYSSTSL